MFQKIFFALALVFAVSVTHAQVRIEGQVGGSNFYGLTANMEPIIKLDSMHTNGIGLSLGVGGMFAWADQPTLIVHGGLHYYYKSWGIGGELSGFAPNPFHFTPYEQELDMLIYPNLSYTFDFKKNHYLKISGGALFAFDKQQQYDIQNVEWEFMGDVIPGIGISFGVKYD